MNLRWWKLSGLAFALAAVAVTARAWAEPEKAAAKAPAADEEKPEASASADDFWLGLLVRPVDPTLRSHLDLPADQGLIVDEVLPGSPAAQGGMKPHDILLRAGEQPLAVPHDLVELVQKSNGKAVQIAALRKGKEQTFEVTPAPRPEHMDSAPGAPGDTARLRQWLDQLERRDALRSPLHLRSFGPGRMLDPNAPGFAMPGFGALPKLPNGYEVSITRKNDEPASIVVKRGADSWTVTENDLDQLPEEVREPVKQMLQQPALPRGFGMLSPGDRTFFDKRFEEMEQRMERMMEEMRGLHAPEPQKEPLLE